MKQKIRFGGLFLKLQKKKKKELIESDDEKPKRGKTREWIRRRKENGYFNNIIKELKVEDRLGSGKCSE